MQTLRKLIILFFPLLGFAQGKHKSPLFKNGGEQEAYYAKQLFKNSYIKEKYPRFKGIISAKDGKYFTYNKQVLIVSATTPELQSIFSSGLFYPQIITGECDPQKPDSLSDPHDLSPLFSCDSMTISEIEELPFLSANVTQKRFRFLLLRKEESSPKLSFMELTNSKASKGITLTDFLKEARLTFYIGTSMTP